ncbi:hypothetical protein LCGC14_0273960 [marine sediment metagenome]|uniref:Uncharacterized protein n=2 Tax=root TaxID=1 RepID=A0A9C9TIM0_9HYPH|nr:hypothetical protein [Aurantimonas coralicida]
MSIQSDGNAYRKRSRSHPVHTRMVTKRRARANGDNLSDPLAIEGHRARPVSCGCGWSGTMDKLTNPAGGPTLGGVNLGPGFPVCPKCKTDARLEA